MDEEAAGTGRNVKRRADRNEEILNWRKLKARLTLLASSAGSPRASQISLCACPQLGL